MFCKLDLHVNRRYRLKLQKFLLKKSKFTLFEDFVYLNYYFLKFTKVVTKKGLGSKILNQTFLAFYKFKLFLLKYPFSYVFFFLRETQTNYSFILELTAYYKLSIDKHMIKGLKKTKKKVYNFFFKKYVGAFKKKVLYKLPCFLAVFPYFLFFFLFDLKINFLCFKQPSTVKSFKFMSAYRLKLRGGKIKLKNFFFYFNNIYKNIKIVENQSKIRNLKLFVLLNVLITILFCAHFYINVIYFVDVWVHSIITNLRFNFILRYFSFFLINIFFKEAVSVTLPKRFLLESLFLFKNIYKKTSLNFSGIFYFLKIDKYSKLHLESLQADDDITLKLKRNQDSFFSLYNLNSLCNVKIQVLKYYFDVNLFSFIHDILQFMISERNIKFKHKQKNMKMWPITNFSVLTKMFSLDFFFYSLALSLKSEKKAFNEKLYDNFKLLLYRQHPLYVSQMNSVEKPLMRSKLRDNLSAPENFHFRW